MVKIGRKAATLAGYMAPANLTSETLLRLVRRALDEATDAETRDGILHQALVKAGVHDVPADFRAFAEFLFGAFREAVNDKLGTDEGQEVVDGLESVVGARYQITPLEVDREAEQAAEQDAVTTLLVVDDDIVVRAQIVQMLRKRGYNAVSAPDSNVALAMCVRYRPKAVLAAAQPDAHKSKQLGPLMRVAFGGEAPPLVLLIGEGETPAVDDAAAVLSKPISDEALAATLLPLLPRAAD